MRTRTNDEYDWYTNLYDGTVERFGVGTKSGGIDGACEFSIQIPRNLERAAGFGKKTLINLSIVLSRDAAKYT